ncbi:MAG: hypothetical protein JST58_16550 [Bacteroidetes bacterium]|jgi:hypothetical protein|nr:hypothetical protein [Bacteroidota bacterium]
MENRNIRIHFLTRIYCLLFAICIMGMGHLYAQDSTAETQQVVKKKSFTKNTFDGSSIIDNQTVMVPVKGTFEFDIQHRFGTTTNGIRDLYGIFSSAIMRLGFSYVPIKNLQVGFGACSDRTQVDLNLKYAIFKQTKDGSMPVSVSYYGNILMDTRRADATTIFVTSSDRFSFFNQISVARKVTNNFSVQASLSLSHFNNVAGYLDTAGKVQPQLKNDNFTLSFLGRYKISPKTAIIVDYDQPLTQNPMNNPHPNIAFGIEMATSGHTFQIFAGNYGYVLPQNNSVYNQNDFSKGQFLIGFNISRLWNF